MRKLLLLFAVFVLIPLCSVFSQTLEDYVLEHRGDTLVVKDDFDMAQNTLYNLLLADSVNVPAGRVYMLHSLGYYSLVNGPTTSSTRKIIIVGEDSRSVKTNQSPDFIPVLTGAIAAGVETRGGTRSALDLEIKNINIEIGNSAGNVGWNWFDFDANARVTVDNCIMEHTLWVMLVPTTNCKTYIRNSYFVNMTGQACRRNGGVVDQFAAGDTLLVENCTHVMAQGMIYKSRNYPINRMIFNHNTFINCAGLLFMNLGYQANASVTNNIFINSNVQSFSGDINMDPGECDIDALPMGIINVALLDSTGYAADAVHFYVDKNLVYWDPIFNDMPSTLNANAVSGYTTWVDQKITMNARTQSMFDANTTYPYLTEGTWIKDKMPTFTDPKDLFTDQLTAIHTYAFNVANTAATDILPMWRVINDPTASFTYADWPIPVDLSYTDADLLTTGLGNFPLGDLNWFPTQMAAWVAQRSAEYAAIHTAVYTGLVGVEEEANLPNKFELAQNYPNPFNPSTDISFTLPHAGNVVLKVFNTLGEEVATLVNSYKEAQTYHINFSAANLPSGVYIYSIKYDNNSVSKKMVLMK